MNIYDRVFSLALTSYGSLSKLLPGNRALPPLIVQFVLTYRCNLDCRMCFQKSYRTGGPARRELSAEEIFAVVDTVPRHALVTLSGGEPLLREDFSRIFSRIAARRRCNMVTNGTLLTDETADLLVRGGLLLAGISVDGPRDVHDLVRGAAGAYDAALSAVRRLVEAKRRHGARRPLIDIKTVVSRENIPFLGDLLALSERSGADFLTLSLPVGAPDDRLSPEDYAALADRAAALRRRSRVRVRTYPEGLLRPPVLSRLAENGIGSGDFLACRYPWLSLNVDPYGTVFPCGPFFEEPLAGRGSRAVWNGPAFRAFREELSRKGMTRECPGNCCYLKFRT